MNVKNGVENKRAALFRKIAPDSRRFYLRYGLTDGLCSLQVRNEMDVIEKKLTAYDLYEKISWVDNGYRM